MLYLGYHLSSVNGFEAMGREAVAGGHLSGGKHLRFFHEKSPGRQGQGH